MRCVPGARKDALSAGNRSVPGGDGRKTSPSGQAAFGRARGEQGNLGCRIACRGSIIPQSGNRRMAHRHYQPLLAQRLGPQCKKEVGLLPFSSWSGLLVPLFYDHPWRCLLSSTWHTNRLLKNAHLRRCPHPSSLLRTFMYASFLRISGALNLGIFEQPANDITLKTRLQGVKFTA